MAKKSKLVLLISLTAVSFILTGCANQMSPGGGDADTVPPQIIELFPENGTTNYHENYFEPEKAREDRLTCCSSFIYCQRAYFQFFSFGDLITETLAVRTFHEKIFCRKIFPAFKTIGFSLD